MRYLCFLTFFKKVSYLYKLIYKNYNKSLNIFL